MLWTLLLDGSNVLLMWKIVSILLDSELTEMYSQSQSPPAVKVEQTINWIAEAMFLILDKKILFNEFIQVRVINDIDGSNISNSLSSLFKIIGGHIPKK